MELRFGILKKIYGMMIGIAAQKRKIVGTPVGDAKAEHVAVKFYGLLHVVDAIGDVTEF